LNSKAVFKPFTGFLHNMTTKVIGMIDKQTSEAIYDASSIKILSQDDFRRRDSLEWLKVDELVRVYKVPRECIERGLEACRMLDIDADEYISRYVTKTNTSKLPELITVYTDLLKKSRK